MASYPVLIGKVKKSLSICSFLCFAAPATSAIEIYDGHLSFVTKDQSATFNLTGTTPPLRTMETTWHKNKTLGTITGEKDTVIIPGTPPTPAVETKIWIPKWQFKDKGRWGKCWNPFTFKDEKCWKPNWKWVDNGHWETKTIIPALPGTPEVRGDTRSGTQLTLGSAGRVAIKSNLGVNGGTVDAQLDYATRIEAPDIIKPGESFRLTIDSSLAEGHLKSLPPSLTGRVSAEIDYRYYTDATHCIAGAGCTNLTNDWWNLSSGNMEILEFNTPNTGENKLSLFGLDEFSFDVPGIPIHADAIVIGSDPGPSLNLPVPGLSRSGVGLNLSTLKFNFPKSHLSGTVDSEGNLLLTHTEHDVITLDVDLDTLALMSGIPIPAGGFVLSDGKWPASFSIRADVLDFGAGPTFDLIQDMKLSPTLMVDLKFDDAVKISDDGINWRLISEWKGRADALPWFELDEFQIVNVDSSFWLDAELQNLTEMLADVSLLFDMGNMSVSIAGAPIWSGNLFGSETSAGLPVVRWSVIDDSVHIGGFNRITGPSFTLAGDMAGANPSGGNPTSVPEPGTLSLLFLGLLTLVRRQLEAKSS